MGFPGYILSGLVSDRLFLLSCKYERIILIHSECRDMMTVFAVSRLLVMARKLQESGAVCEKAVSRTSSTVIPATFNLVVCPHVDDAH